MTKKWAYLPEELENLNEIILYLEKLVLHSFCEEVLSGVRQEQNIGVDWR